MLYHNDLKYFLKGCLELLVYFPYGSAGKESAYSVGELGSIPELGRSPGEGNGYPLQYSGLENSMAYSPWGQKELDTTDQLSLFYLNNFEPLDEGGQSLRHWIYLAKGANSNLSAQITAQLLVEARNWCSNFKR